MFIRKSVIGIIFPEDIFQDIYYHLKSLLKHRFYAKLKILKYWDFENFKIGFLTFFTNKILVWVWYFPDFLVFEINFQSKIHLED